MQGAAKQDRKCLASAITLQPDITKRHCSVTLLIPAKSILGALFLSVRHCYCQEYCVVVSEKGKMGARPLLLQTSNESPFCYVISRDNEEPHSPPPMVVILYSPCQTGAKGSFKNRSVK